jgi:hypothetical protein
MNTTGVVEQSTQTFPEVAPAYFSAQGVNYSRAFLAEKYRQITEAKKYRTGIQYQGRVECSLKPRIFKTIQMSLS